MNENLGKKIKSLREKSKLTQEQLAEKLNVYSSTISKWENGHAIPDLMTIKQIAKVLKVDVNSLIDDVKIPKNKITFKYILKSVWGFLKKNLILMIGIIIFICLLVFLINNYNFVEYYYIKPRSEDFLFKKNYLILSKYRNILYLDNIENLYKEYNEDKVNIELYTIVNGDKYILYTGNNFKRIFIDELASDSEILTKESINALKKQLYMNIVILDEKGKEHRYEIKFDVIKKFSNNKIIYNPKEDSLKNDELNKYAFLTYANLINHGFKKKPNEKVFKKESKNEEIELDLDANTYKIIKVDKNIKYKYLYCFKEGSYCFSKNVKNKIEIKYRYQNNKLYCEWGDCRDYKKYNNYVRNRFYQLSKKES